MALSQRSWSCMDEVDGRFATASAAHSHVLGYLGLQPWYGLRGGITFPFQYLCTSARCQPAFSFKPQNQLCPVIFEGLSDKQASQPALGPCFPQAEKLGTNQSMPLTPVILCSQAAFPTKTQEKEEGSHPGTASQSEQGAHLDTMAQMCPQC